MHGEQTLRTRGQAKLRALCDVLGLRAEQGRAFELFHVMSETFGERPSGAPPAFHSDITDDHSPFELSLALEGGQPELRMLIEAQGEPATLRSNWEAAWRLNERLEQAFGVSLERARKVEDLFRPEEVAGRFTLWHAVCLKSGAAPDFKIYLNPRAAGEGRASPTVQEALGRLGLTRAWEWIRSNALRRGARDRVIYFSLDLSDRPSARVKIYVAHEEATAGEIEGVMAGGPEYQPEDARRFCAAMTRSEGPYRVRPIITCMAFVAQDDARPSTVTFHLPIRCYVASDLVAMQRVCRFLAPADAAIYERAITAMAERRLDAGVGLQTYASFRRQGGRERLTVYLSPELYQVQAPNTSN